MIIDIHTHLWPKSEITEYLVEYLQKRCIWDEWYTALTTEGLLRVMDDNDIDLSVVSAVGLGLNTKNDYLENINHYVMNEIKKAPERLIGFCVVDPYGGKRSVQFLKRYIEEHDFKGLKLHPSIQSFFPNDKRTYPLYKTMEDYGLPVLFHSGAIGIKPFRDKYSNPVHLDDIACDFPELKIIIGHAGKIWHAETAMLLRKHNNIFADISGNIGRDEKYRAKTLEHFLFLAKTYAGALDRVLFGTDYPLFFQEETLKVLEEAIVCLNKNNPDFIINKDLANIKFRNAEKLLDISISRR